MQHDGFQQSGWEAASGPTGTGGTSEKPAYFANLLVKKEVQALLLKHMIIFTSSEPATECHLVPQTSWHMY